MAEKTEIKVTVAGESLELILPGQGWTFEEAKLAKAVSEGMAPVEIEQALQLADPDAWIAVLRVSYMRANKDFPAGRISGEDVLELADAVTDAIRKAVKELPPTNRNGSESSEPSASTEPAPTASPS